MTKTDELYELICKAYRSAEDDKDFHPFKYYHTAEDWNAIICGYIYKNSRPVDFSPVCYGVLAKRGFLVRSEVKIEGRWKYKFIPREA